MTDAHDTPTLDDVMGTAEQAVPNRREHAKASPHPDDDALEERQKRNAKRLGSRIPRPSAPASR